MQQFLLDNKATSVCGAASYIESSRIFARTAETWAGGDNGQVVTLLNDHLAPCVGGCEEDRAARSGLNYDETPLQLCLALRPSGYKWRALIDPGVAICAPSTRFSESKRILERSLRQAGAAAFQSDFDQLIALQGPNNELSVTAFDYGVFWIGAEINGRGRSIYIDASVGAPDAYWARALKTLLSLSASAGEITRIVNILSDHTIPMSVGMEVRGHSRRLKVHTRLVRRPPPHIMGQIMPMLSDPDVAAAVAVLMENGNALSLHGFVLEAAFDAETGILCDAKIDIAAPEVCHQRCWLKRVQRVAEILGVTWPEEITERISGSSRLAYIGIGKDTNAQSRLNLYFTPGTSYARHL